MEVLLTTCDRIELLRGTVESYLSAKDRPNGLWVFDDASTDEAAVREATAPVAKSFDRRQHRLGAHVNTPQALADVFARTGTDVILVLDSDTEFASDWWPMAQRLFDRARQERGFACLSLFDDCNFESYPTLLDGLRTKQGVGAFGTVITRDYFDRYVRPEWDAGRPNWDYKASRKAFTEGFQVFVTDPSVLQHTGTMDGTHVGGSPSVALNFERQELSYPDILIPTCKSEIEIAPLMCDIEGFSEGCRVIATCTKASAAVNRNIALDRSTSNIVIMADDDITGFYDGWWRDMLAPFRGDKSVCMVSARLLRPDGTPGTMVGNNYNLDPPMVDVADRELPTACVAFWRDGTKFDEGFVGSGFEDNWFCRCLQKKYPQGRFVINNKCRLVHINEMKNQHGPNWDHNRKHFEELCRSIN